MAVGRKIKGFLFENNISQKDLAKKVQVSDSSMSDKLNENIKISADEFYIWLLALNQLSDKKVDANYFMPLGQSDDVSNSPSIKE